MNRARVFCAFCALALPIGCGGKSQETSPANRGLPPWDPASEAFSVAALHASGELLIARSNNNEGASTLGLLLPDGSWSWREAVPDHVRFRAVTPGEQNTLVFTGWYQDPGFALPLQMDRGLALLATRTGLVASTESTTPHPGPALLPGPMPFVAFDRRLGDNVSTLVRATADGFEPLEVSHTAQTVGRIGDDLLVWDSATLSRMALDGTVSWSSPLSSDRGCGTANVLPSWRVPGGTARMVVCSEWWSVSDEGAVTALGQFGDVPSCSLAQVLENGDALATCPGGHVARVTPEGTTRWTADLFSGTATPEDEPVNWPFLLRLPGARQVAPLIIGGTHVYPTTRWLDLSRGVLLATEPDGGTR